MTTGKTIALTIETFVGRVTSLLFNTLFRFVIPEGSQIPFKSSLSKRLHHPCKYTNPGPGDPVVKTYLVLRLISCIGRKILYTAPPRKPSKIMTDK